MNDEFSRASEHIWKYFELHAQQRMTVFNFYIAITGLLAAGIGVTLQQGGKYVLFTSLMGVFVAFISFIFWKLDQRVSILIKNAEIALQDLECQFSNEKLRIITKDNSSNLLNLGISSSWTYGKCFRISFVIVGLTGVLLAITPFLMKVSTS
ncbi:hypothetical protein O4O19_004863 [Escherichia coli]|uniref:hypothetical protein n=1 Tax=Escherichia TaxID=561 RepID=UPI001299B6D9|nr:MULTISPECIES: hypothetical protein [Escherichia]EFC1525721.1 hypothetical protein [Escherichia coli]EFC9526250.1 hypothetical protein [Escherichia coli]EFE0601300.1 hypothetical protein [Escherichia coli]EFL3124743.1 hypothetical protein [Escherichia coli]EGD0621562.1 hypothetical protein [Escherichia coli]